MLYTLPIYSGGIRTANAFVGYMPGVNSSGEVSINGSNGRVSEILIDGGSATIPESGGVNWYFPGFEAFQEMKLITSTFNPEYGRLGGGLQVYTSKSGTNDIHGSLFWYLRRDIFDAAGWTSNQNRNNPPGYRGKTRLNEQGGTVGGPVYIPKLYDGRNKTFFYFTYERDGRPAVPVITGGLTVPTTLMKQGNFTQLAYPVYDPATTTTSDGVTTRLPFAGNLIPTSRWSKISSNIVPVIPDPNTGGGLTSNYTLNGANEHKDRLFTIKADHAFTASHRVSFFMTNRSYYDIAPANFSGPLSNGLQSGQYPEDYRGNYDWIISPTKVLHVTFSNSQTIQRWNNPEQNGWGSKFGFPGLVDRADATPYISFSTDALTWYGMNQGKVDNGGQFNYTYHWSGNLSWVRGKHEFKFGGDVRRLQTTGDDWAGTNGSYSFSRFQTADPLAKNSTGNAFASFLLGAVDSASQMTLPVVIGQIRYSYHSGYFQDSWRLTPKLTLIYGMRYEVPIGWHSRDGLYSNLDINRPNPGAGGLKGSIVYAGWGAGREGVKRFYPTDFSNFGPRAGIAYRLTPRTTLRAGFGIFYQTLGNGGCGCTDGIGGAPKSAISDGLNAALNWDNGIAATSTGISNRFSPTVDNFYSGVYRQGPNYGMAPRIYNWSFTLQQELKNFLFEAAYDGNRGYRLNSTVYMNQLPTSYLSLGSLLGKNINDPAVAAAGYKEPFAGFAAGWKGAATLAQALRPFPQYGTVVDINAGIGRTWYDSLQTKVQRKFGDLQLTGSYVWSKTLSLMTYRQIFSQGSNVQAQDSYNIADAKSLSPMDIPHFVNILTSYRLPFGRNKRFFSGSNRALDMVIGGWTISAVQQYRSGNLLQIYNSGNPLGTGVIFSPVTRANHTGAAIRTGQGATEMDPNNPNSRFLNPDAFVAAPAYTLGTTSMFLNEARNPWWRSENFSVSKDFPFMERVKLNYRADFMNLFNRSSLSDINVTLGNANFGRPSRATYGGRYISMGLRAEF